jgi:hypothetical protein
VLAETGQEVPGWLGNIAQRHAPYGQKSRRGGGRFGGRDFRKDFGGHNNCEYLGRCVRLVPALFGGGVCSPSATGVGCVIWLMRCQHH